MDEFLARAATIVSVMIIINMIVEKIVSFWKLNGGDALNTKQDKPAKEKQREMKISNSALIVGIVIALFLKVDFIELIGNKNAEQTFGWDFVTLDVDPACNGKLKADALYTEKTLEYFKTLRADLHPVDSDTTLRIIMVVTVALTFLLFFVFVSFRAPREGRTFREIITPRRSLSYNAVVLAIIFLFISTLIASLNDSWLLFYRYSCIFFSSVLAGAGVSFGSKFWHDFLDIILELKNFRKKLTDSLKPPQAN